MVETDQFRYELNSYDEPLKELRSALDLDNKAKKIEELEMHMEDQGFWNDPETSQKKLKELKALKDAFTNYNELEKLRDDARTFMEIADEENDTSIIPDIEELVNEFKNLFEKVFLAETALSLKHPTGVFVATQPRAFERLLVLFKGFVLRLQKSFFCLSAWRSSIIPYSPALCKCFFRFF